ncbi:MAG: hypothetical protein WC522_07330 [Candidatus Omnitrophota bacterium]
MCKNINEAMSIGVSHQLKNSRVCIQVDLDMLKHRVECLRNTPLKEHYEEIQKDIDKIEKGILLMGQTFKALMGLSIEDTGKHDK